MKEHMMNKQQGIRAKFKSRQQGAVAIIVAICLTLLIAMIGLVVDLGHMFVIKTELQNAADACALAAARELDGNANSLERAENAGITIGQRNNVDLQNTEVSISPADVTFSVDNVSYVSQDAGALISSKYVMCTLRRSGIAMWFMQVVGFSNQAVAARAVATLQPAQTSCAIPLGICKPQSSEVPASCPNGGAPDSVGMCVGEWYSGKFDAGEALTGSFNWISFIPKGGGATEISETLAGAGQCDLTIADEVKLGDPGAKQSVAKAWNSRFGLYQGQDQGQDQGQGQGNFNIEDSPPDFTGYAYTPTSWPDEHNALSDFDDKQAAHAPYQGDGETGLKNIDNKYNVTQLAELKLKGANRRLVTAPLVNCSEWTGDNQIPIRNWACVLMLHPIGAINTNPGGGPKADDDDTPVQLEYAGLSSDPSSPCTTFGIPGGTAGPLVPVLVQ
jgi:hypothetical protein